MFIFHCFNLNSGNNDTGRMVHLKQDRSENLVRNPSAGAVAEWADRRGKEEAEMPDWAKRNRHASLEPLRTEVDTTADTRRDLDTIPHPVTPKAKEKLRARTERDIFGSRETQEWYLKAIREALEKMNGDDLYDFIRAHSSYEKKSGHVEWNRDFAKLFNLTIEKEHQGADEDTTNRRITAATQHLLVEYYNNDVFQLTQKMPNPWIFIDGRMGPYTVSVLSEYWTAKYSKTSIKRPIPPGDAHVAGDYKPGSAEAKLYDAALRYRDGQIKKPKEGDNAPPPPAEPAAETEVPAEIAGDKKVKARYAKLDRVGDSVQISDLKIDRYACDTDMKLSVALGLAYEEDPNPADKDTRKSPRLFRALNLLAQRVGAEVDSMDIKTGDTIALTEKGKFTVTASDNKIRYEVDLQASTEQKPPAEPAEEEEAEPVPEKNDDQVKEELAGLDQAGDTINNATDLPINHSLRKNYISPDLALGEAYGKKGEKKEACVNRVLNLLAQKLGAKITAIPFAAGDVIEITTEGNFSITKPDGTIRYVPIKIF